MGEICCGIVGEREKTTSTPCEPSSRAARRKRMEIRRLKFIAGVDVASEIGRKRRKLEISSASSVHDCDKDDEAQHLVETESEESNVKENSDLNSKDSLIQSLSTCPPPVNLCPKFGMTSVCGRRKDMEDTVAIHPSFCQKDRQTKTRLHFFGVYDGHGCSHVAMSCKDRLHQIVKEELENRESSSEWKEAIDRSFSRMDQEVLGSRNDASRGNCRCDLQTPQCDAVGSTAVVAIVTPDTLVVANCGDSRAVLCRGGKSVPLSTDHKPDRADELLRIQEAGGRVIYWDGPRVLGVLAMSRAIGDNYLKPYVSSEPEVTVTDRTEDDECLILASDGLWDVVSNEMACSIVRMCLLGKESALPHSQVGDKRTVTSGEGSTKRCSVAASLLTKLALARNSTDNVSVVIVDLRRDMKKANN